MKGFCAESHNTMKTKFTNLKLEEMTMEELKCHASGCGCTMWYDRNGNGLCDGTNWADPEKKCGHPVINHFSARMTDILRPAPAKGISIHIGVNEIDPKHYGTSGNL